MENWKRALLRAAGFGAGFALAGAIILGGFVWWSSRPKKPKPWNEAAITAKYDSSGVEGQDQDIYVAYDLKNNTDSDISISDDSEVHLGAQLQRGDAMSFSDGKILSIDYPIFIPARRTARCEVHLKYPYKEPYNASMPDDQKTDYYTRLAKYMTDELGNLNGFVLLYDASRYQINLPPGWKERSKEPMRVRTATAH